MKTVILAGGFGTRLAEETHLRPKPMVEVGGIPLLVHVMSIYHLHGFSDFLIACGYKGECIKEYFANFQICNSDWALNLRDGTRRVVRAHVPNWDVAPIDTGLNTLTGGRIARLQSLIGNETFMVTYGDGVSDVDITRLVEFHKSHGRLATITAVHPPARFGCLEIEAEQVTRFAEKPQTSEGWINGGFFVFEPEVFDYLNGDSCVLEKTPLERLSNDGQLMAYQHDGFWQPMDTVREKMLLEELWAKNTAPWRGTNDDDFFRGLSRQEGTRDRTDRLQRPVVRKVA
ncbi:MAG: glucose-1-phosphate cytidylyltransferase [Pirellulaceae bacterium]